TLERRTGHILVVEDDQDIRESVVEILEDEGHRVSAAADGREALERLQRAQPRPDLILLDLMMPVMNGFQFREEQLKRPELAGIPVVVDTPDVPAGATTAHLRAAAVLLNAGEHLPPLGDGAAPVERPARARRGPSTRRRAQARIERAGERAARVAAGCR